MIASLNAVPRAARLLGFAGLIPFVVPAIGVWFVPLGVSELLHMVIIAYGMVIASFMAGVQWGFGSVAALDDAKRLRVLGLSVIPALLVWIGAFTPFPWPYAFLLVTFLMVLRHDLRLIDEGLAPTWYRGLRLPLTGVVLVALTVALAHGIAAR